MIVTAALPYANGAIHLGHMVEHCMVDFWVRFQKMQGHDCIFICADDTHGTPIMIKAREMGMPAEKWITLSLQEHTSDLRGFQIHYESGYLVLVECS